MRKIESVLLVDLLFTLAAFSFDCGGPAQNEPTAVEQTPTAQEPVETPNVSTEPAGKALIWKIESIEDPAETFFLLGSIHAASADFYPLDPAIEDVYEASDSLVVEVNLTALSKEKMMQVVLSRAMLPPGQILKDKLEADAWEKLEAVLNKYQLPIEAVMRFKPWFAALTLVTLRVASDGYNPEFGIDQYFMKKGGKEILELESADSQLALFDGLSQDLEQLLLLDAIEGQLQAGGELEKVMDAWLEGDAEKLKKIIFGDIEQKPEFKPLFKKLIVDRNYSMAAGIEKLLGQGKKLFVVVGAGHLVGDEGIVAIFEGRGYRTEQLEKRNPLSASP
jgi:uncharacterized protein YbaP (TraB family)